MRAEKEEELPPVGSVVAGAGRGVVGRRGAPFFSLSCPGAPTY
jgi:hypothetical protein